MNEEISDDKLKERVILLMRLYWLEDLFNIGKELSLPHVNNVTHYWELEPYKIALAIAQTLNDNELINLVSSHAPKYVEFGGFQGQFYTASKIGIISLTSSWEKVRTNVNKALEKWGYKTYGVLKALINKKGSASYFDLIDEIEKVLSYEFVPSYLLPRLAPLKLVFKTGSNKYPSWTIPTEIMPVVNNELEKFVITHKISKVKVSKLDTDETKLLLIERHLDNLIETITERKCEINLIFQRQFKIKLFRDNERAIMSIKKPCSNEEDFNYRIQSLCVVVDDIETDNLRNLLKISNSSYGSIKLIEIFLETNNLHYNKELIETLRMIRILRNKKFPTHKDDPKFIEAVQYFGVNYPIEDWQLLWERILEKFTKTLIYFIEALQSHN